MMMRRAFAPRSATAAYTSAVAASASRRTAVLPVTNTMDVSSDEARAKFVSNNCINFLPFAFMGCVVLFAMTERKKPGLEVREKGLSHLFYRVLTRNKPEKAPVANNNSAE